MAGHPLPGLDGGPQWSCCAVEEGVKFALRAAGFGLRACYPSQPIAHNTIPESSNQSVRKVSVRCWDVDPDPAKRWESSLLQRVPYLEAGSLGGAACPGA